MFNKLLFLLFVFVFSASAGAQNKSIYTSLAADQCKTIDVDRGMPGNYSGRCRGVGGFDLEVYLDDERNSLGVVLPSKDVIGLEFWNHFSGFSELGEKAEWRMKDEKPVALIVRLNVSDREDKPQLKTSYLVVSKISPSSACVTDIVKPGKNQNAQARILADQASSKPCKTSSSDSKSEAVKRLTDLTFPSHPYVGIEAEIAKLPGANTAKEVAEMKEADRKQRIEVFEDALKVNNKLTAEQKTFVRASYDRLSKTINDIIDETIKINFPTEQWIMEGLNRSYSAKFTLKELNDLVEFFDSVTGSQVLKYIRQTNMEQLITGNGGKLDFTAANLAEHDKFVATALGKKFIAAYIKETEEYEQLKEGEVRTRVPNADGFALLEPANLNKFFNQFVADNYKK